MADDEKSGIVREVIKNIPANDRERIGIELGQILVNVTSAGSAITQLLRPIPMMAWAVSQLFARANARRMKIPPSRRVAPSAQVLLASATGYAAAPRELQEKYENLLLSAMDLNTAASVLPAYAGILAELDPLSVKVFDSLGGHPTPYRGYHDFGRAVGGGPAEVQIALDNLVRLGLLDRWSPDATGVGPSGPFRAVSSLTLQVGTASQPANPGEGWYIFNPTALGRGFHSVCSARGSWS